MIMMMMMVNEPTFQIPLLLCTLHARMSQFSHTIP